MDDREIVRKIAIEVMGWREASETDLRAFVMAEDDIGFLTLDCEWGVNRYWNPLTSIAAAFEMQQAIAASGRESEYTMALLDVVCPSLWNWWEIAHASPRARCEAVVRLLDDSNGKHND